MVSEPVSVIMDLCREGASSPGTAPTVCGFRYLLSNHSGPLHFFQQQVESYYIQTHF